MHGLPTSPESVSYAAAAVLELARQSHYKRAAMPFSIHERGDLMRRLHTEAFDILVVGGGITGAGVARDAAMRGLKVALVERGDFAVGTSSRSTKLIHGGLRYLEMGDIGLVFEAVRERQRLLQLAPHLAKPQSFVLPVMGHSKHGVFALDVGLTLYDMLAAFSGVMRHRAVRKKALLRLEPALNGKSLSGGVRYFDATTDDARLVLANVRGAVLAGAACVSRVTFVAPNVVNGRITGATLRDELSQSTHTIAAKVIVAAAGPWTDAFAQQWQAATQGAATELPPLQPSKGVHVVVPKERLPLQHAVTMTSPLDGRVVFALPWPLATVIGTTDTAYSGPLDEPQCTWEDADYLVRTVNGCLLPTGGPLQVADVVSTWAGIRPLVAQAGAATYKVSREHVITADPVGLVTVAGGKLTTYRVMAEQAVDEALVLLAHQATAVVKPCQTGTSPLPGAEALRSKSNPLVAVAAAAAQQFGLDSATARHFAERYGSDTTAVCQLCAHTEAGFDPVLPQLPYRWGELAWLVREEMAMDLVDLMVRRTQLYYVAGDQLLPIAADLALRMAQWCGLPPQAAPALADQLVAYIAAHRVQPQPQTGDAPA